MIDACQQVRVSHSTATGRRPNNQDAAIALQLNPADSLWGFRAVVAVADGMGGHSAGEVASRIAADTIAEVLSLQTTDTSDMAARLSGAPAADAVLYAVQLANVRIYQQAQTDAAQYDMGTTLTVVALTDDTAVVAHIGDSRGYRISSGAIHQITQDHSWVARQVQEQRMTEEEAARSPLRNQVTRTLGVADTVVPDLVSIPLETGSIYLVCSDGLTEVLPNEDIASTINATATVGEGCEALVNRALERGVRDNVTVACVEYGMMPRGQATPPATAAIQQEAAACQLYPSHRRHSSGASPIAVQRLTRAGVAAGAVLLIAAILLLRSCLLASGRSVSEDIEPPPEEHPVQSAVQLPPIEEGLTIKVMVIEGELVAAANRHVETTIHALGAADSEPRTTIGPDRDYVRALSEQEAQSWADETCQITLWVEDGYMHWRTEPEDMNLYINRKMEKSDRLKLSALGEGLVRLGFYFPANDADGYTVALTQIDVGGLPEITTETVTD